MDRLLPILTDNLDIYVSGLLVTLLLVSISFVVAMVVGTLIASFRIAPAKPLNWIGGFYVETFRNVPLARALHHLLGGVHPGGASTREDGFR